MNNAISTTTDGGKGLPFKSDVNFAKDENVKKWVGENLVNVVDYARYDRQILEEEWREIRRMVLLEHDTNQKYLGRSVAYIPAYAKARGTVISELSRAMFPSEDYLDVTFRSDDKMESSKKAKDYLQYEFEKQMKVRSHIKTFLSQFVDYGFTVAKAWYEKGTSYKQYKASKNKDGNLLIEASTPDNAAGARFSTRSVFYWYIWPTTVDSIDEATVVFEDIDVTIYDAKRLAHSGNWTNLDEAIAADGREPMHDFNVMQQQSEIMGTPSNPRTSPSPQGDLSRVLTAQECWLDMPIPDSEYADNEVKGTPVPCKVTIIGGVVVEARRNPFWHQKKPYLVSRMRTFPGSFYPKGAGTMARFLQYLVNDFTNQLNDNGTFALNPIVLANPNTMAGPLPSIEPGAVFQTTDTVNGIKFDRPPVEQLQYGKMLVEMYQGMLYDVAGAPPILQGTNAGKGARTATSSQILQKNASNPIQDVVEDMENDVMVPLMQMVWTFGNQYRTSPINDEMNGQLLIISPDDIMGDVTMKFLASSMAANQQQRAQQAMALLQILPPLVPLLQASGKMADPSSLLQRIYSDGFGFRNFDQFIKAAPPPQMPGMGAPGQPGQPGLPGQNAGDSAIPGETESASGEGEDFADVRDNADVLSAIGGAQS
jgi:hypothetical protein